MHTPGELPSPHSPAVSTPLSTSNSVASMESSKQTTPDAVPAALAAIQNGSLALSQLMAMSSQNPQLMLQNQLAAAVASTQQPQIQSPLPPIGTLSPQELSVSVKK